MTYRLCLLIVGLLMSGVTFGQRIHTIIFGDTNDQAIGQGVQVNVNHFMEFTLDVASGLGMEQSYTKQVYVGSMCSKSRLMQVLQNFQCASNDIVLFGYFGHGGRDPKDVSEFPQMCLAERYASNYVPLEDVKNLLVNKGAAFVLVMGDCCNNYASIGAKFGTISAQGPTVLTSSDTEVMRKLFQMRGAVIASGCQKGEYSWVNSLSGGFFTNGFLDEFDRYTQSAPSNPNWNDLFVNVRTNVLEFSRSQRLEHGGKRWVQTPIYRVEKRGEGRKVVDNPRRDVVDDGTIRSKLLTLIDKSVSPATRIQRIQGLRSLFTDDSQVQIVGSDHTTILGVETAEDYMSHAVTSKYLNNFVVVKEERSAMGQISRLVIHEIHVKKD